VTLVRSEGVPETQVLDDSSPECQRQVSVRRWSASRRASATSIFPRAGLERLKTAVAEPDERDPNTGTKAALSCRSVST